MRQLWSVTKPWAPFMAPLFLCACLSPTAPPAGTPAAQGILTEHCVLCHGIEETEAGLDLRNLRGILKGGQSGPAIVWGDPQNSLLLEMVSDGHMPPEGDGLSAEEITFLGQWIQQTAYPLPLD